MGSLKSALLEDLYCGMKSVATINLRVVACTKSIYSCPDLHIMLSGFAARFGDFGNENVELVKAIGSLDLPKAVILGNHDCWNTGQFSKKGVDRVQTQLACYVFPYQLEGQNPSLQILGSASFLQTTVEFSSFGRTHCRQ
eukprot:Gb_33177 [translate_table: standard]